MAPRRLGLASGRGGHWRAARAEHAKIDTVVGTLFRHYADHPEELPDGGGAPGADMVVPFGAALHASGTDADALAASVRRVAQAHGLKAEAIEPGLEDVFIHLMRRAPEPVAARPEA